jgi:hypothetical protein
MELLVCRHQLARELNIDARTIRRRGVSPAAYLLTGTKLLPLYEIPFLIGPEPARSDPRPGDPPPVNSPPPKPAPVKNP